MQTSTSGRRERERERESVYQTVRMNECSLYDEGTGEMLQEKLMGGGEGEECMRGSCSKKRMRHINNERQRRILMNTLLDSLQALLPDPQPRKDRCALLTDVIVYIQSLEEEVQDLDARTTHMKKVKPKVALSGNNNKILPKKLVSASLRNVHVQSIDRPPEKSTATISSPLSNRSEEIILTFVSSPIRGLLPHVLAHFQMSQIEVIHATVSTTPDAGQMLYYIHACVPKDCSFRSDEFKVVFSQMTLNEEDVSYNCTLNSLR